MSVYKKLQKVKCELQSKSMKKSGKNNFSGYHYFELGDFLPTIVELFDAHGLFSCVSFSSELATLKIIDTDDNSEVIFTSPMGSASLKGCHEVQNIGAVETYQRRYLYVTALDIVEHDALEPLTGKKDEANPDVDLAKEAAKAIESATHDLDKMKAILKGTGFGIGKIKRFIIPELSPTTVVLVNRLIDPIPKISAVISAEEAMGNGFALDDNNWK